MAGAAACAWHGGDGDKRHEEASKQEEEADGIHIGESTVCGTEYKSGEPAHHHETDEDVPWLWFEAWMVDRVQLDTDVT